MGSRVVMLVVIAALLLVPACGNAGDDDEATSSNGLVTGEFCTDARAFEALFAAMDFTDPATFDEEFSAIVEEFRTIEPPPEITEDWHTAFSILGSDPDRAGAGFDAAALAEANRNVASYLDQECGPAE